MKNLFIENIVIQHSIYKNIEAFLLVISLSYILLACNKAQSSISTQSNHKIGKITGLSLVGSVRAMEEKALNPILNVKAKWLALMPYAFCRKDSTHLYRENQRQWWGERREGIIQTTLMAQKKQLQLMYKPHLWIMRGGFTGDFDLGEDKKWEIWEKEYEAYILDYAHLADSLKVELLCIGTELETFVKKRPDFWEQLIAKVRKKYTGKITYAANWDEYTRFPFWDKVDFIGIDAYFPLSEAQTPELKELLDKWQVHFKTMKSFYQKTDKQIVFTEFGYRSIDQTANKPWEFRNKEIPINQTAQANSLEAIFQKFFNEKWFAGGFLWKWYDYHEKAGGKDNTDFTPQNKLAEQIIQNWYAKFSD